MDAKPSQQRVTLVAGELLGYVRTGGLGTATTYLSVALARLGHKVDVLYTGQPPFEPVPEEWRRLYEDAGVNVRLLPRGGDPVDPPFFAQIRDVERALTDEPPDVVIAQDLAAPAYAALRLRSLGLGFERTLFVVYCHGTRQWITDVSRKVRVLPGALAISALERASLELSDVVVSPSAYLVDWMRRQGWDLPEATHVIPYLTRSAATSEQVALAGDADPVERVAFFGRLEERKGIRPFAAALDTLEPELLTRIEVEFVGRATPAWPPERVEALLSPSTREALRALSFHTELDQSQALGRLARPGTLAVMPSLEDNSPNAVYECLERGIPFAAGNSGGAGELVAPEDRAEALFEPSAAGVEAALRRALADGARAARPAFDQEAVLAMWGELVAGRPERTAPAETADGDAWIVLPEGLGGDARETLAAAQRASGADVVTCAVHVEGGADHYFLGEPGALGLLSNAYGTVALIRRSLLTDVDVPDAADPAWPLLARLSAAGARIVSIPLPLATSHRPGSLERQPADALLVAQALERAAPEALRSAARLVAGLAADAQPPARATPGLARRARAVLRRSLERR